jgi:hypothetical protein
MDASCASRDISTVSFWKFVLRESECHLKQGESTITPTEERTNMSAAAVRCAGPELSRDMYSVLRSHETFAAMGGVPPPCPCLP